MRRLYHTSTAALASLPCTAYSSMLCITIKQNWLANQHHCPDSSRSHLAMTFFRQGPATTHLSLHSSIDTAHDVNDMFSIILCSLFRLLPTVAQLLLRPVPNNPSYQLIHDQSRVADTNIDSCECIPHPCIHFSIIHATSACSGCTKGAR